jgi:hypothetical protein
MFTSLDEVMKHDNEATSTRKERRLFYIAVTLVSIIAFIGLYAAIKYLG